MKFHKDESKDSPLALPKRNSSYGEMPI